MSAEILQFSVYPKERVSRRPLAFDPSFDSRAYIDLLQLRKTNPSEHLSKRNELISHTRKQHETHLGERFNVLISNFRYEISDGKIKDQLGEPFEEVIKRGRDHRRAEGNPEDWPREDAEVIGFPKIQAKLCYEEAEVGDMMMQFSPPSGAYQHNFYDIFRLMQDSQGQRYIEARRYSSGLSPEESAEAIPALNPDTPVPHLLRPEFFLANPFEPVEFKDPDEIHKFLHRNHNYMTPDDFSYILKFTRPFIDNYIAHLLDNPYDTRNQIINFNAILNAADEAWEIRNGGAGRFNGQILGEVTHEAIFMYGTAPVREVKTGCGYSGGFELAMSPYSVADFAPKKDEYGNLEFECPSCKQKIRRPMGRLVGECPHCGSTAVACDPTQKEPDNGVNIKDLKGRADVSDRQIPRPAKKVA